MNNVIKFPRLKKTLPNIAFDSEKIKAAMPSASTVNGVIAWLWFAVRVPVFLVLYWLRLPVVLVCNLLSVPLLFAWLFAWYAFPEKHAMVWGFAVISLVAFVAEWLYDLVLMAISPQAMMKTL